VRESVLHIQKTSGKLLELTFSAPASHSFGAAGSDAATAHL